MTPTPAATLELEAVRDALEGAALTIDWGTVGQALGAWLVIAAMLYRFVHRITRAARTVVDSTKANTAALVRLDHRIETLEQLERRRLDVAQARDDRDEARRRPPPPMERRRHDRD